MMPRTVTEAEARRILKVKYDLPVVLWASQHMECGRFQATICDYSGMPGYTVKYAVAVYDRKGDMVDRFNVNR